MDHIPGAVFSDLPPAGSRTRFQYGTASKTNEDTMVLSDRMSKAAGRGTHPDDARHHLKRKNVFDLCMKSTLFRDCVARWKNVCVCMDEVKAVESDILCAFVITSDADVTDTVGMAVPPQFMDSVLVNVRSTPVHARIDRALQGQPGSAISKTKADSGEPTQECIRGLHHVLEPTTPNKLGLLFFRMEPVARPLQTGSGETWNFDMASGRVSVLESCGTGALRQLRFHCGGPSDSLSDVAFLSIVEDTGNTMFATYTTLVGMGICNHFVPGAAHREHNAITDLCLLADLPVHQPKVRWPCGSFLRGPHMGKKEGTGGTWKRMRIKSWKISRHNVQTPGTVEHTLFLEYLPIICASRGWHIGGLNSERRSIVACDQCARSKRTEPNVMRWMNHLTTSKTMVRGRGCRMFLSDLTIITANASPYNAGMPFGDVASLGELFNICSNSLQIGSHLLRDDSLFAIEHMRIAITAKHKEEHSERLKRDRNGKSAASTAIQFHVDLACGSWLDSLVYAIHAANPSTMTLSGANVFGQSWGRAGTVFVL